MSMKFRAMIKALVGVALLISLLAFVNPQEIIDQLSRASLGLLLIALLCFSLQGVMEAVRLKIVFSSYNISFPEGLRLFFAGLFFANFLPGGIGAELYQLQQMNQRQKGLAMPAALLLYLRVNGLLVNLILGALALGLLAPSLRNGLGISFSVPVPDWLIFGIIAILLIVSGLAWIYRDRLQRHLWNNPYAQDARTALRNASDSVTAGSHLGITLISFFIVLLRVATVCVLLLSLSTPANVLPSILAVTFSTIAVALPISIGGLGVGEASLAAVLVAGGISVTVAGTVSILIRIFIWILSLVGGLIFLVGKSDSKDLNER